jgi:YD repeat-containing protein
VTYSYDAADQLTRVTDWSDGQYTYGYDAAGRPNSLQLPNGVKTGLRYDIAGRLTCMDHVSAQNPNWALASYRYTLDAVGNRMRAMESSDPCGSRIRLPIVLKNATGAMMMVPLPVAAGRSHARS